ncbi:MAG: glycosyltransferase family 2 protein [Thermodesulfobacteriota bacterium]|nr:glycosyltransferase family 2 protein [Thermodesulfobacteriota bacterium]
MFAEFSGHTISVVIPTLNEEETIAQIIEGCRPHAGEILVVDGHSKDKTRQIAEGLRVKVIQDHKKGKGEAIRYSINQVTGDIIVFIDADGSHNPDDIPKLIQPIIEDRADHVSGSRLIGGSSELHGGFDECFRLMGSSFVTACINWKFNVRLSESQNGFRAIRTDVIKQLGLRENITTIEQEMIIKTLKKGFRMVEVPTHENERTAGYSKISLKKVWFRYVYSLVKYLFWG